MEASTSAAKGEADTPLKRTLTKRTLTIFVIGDTVGAGIYALVGEVGAEVGGAIWTAFTVALILALLTAFAYAELVTKYPQAAGSALYVDKAYKTPFLTFMIGFAVMASGIASASTLARAFAGDYFSEFIDAPIVLIALIFIVVIAAINLRGIAESVKINVVLTAIEVTGLALIVLIGVVALGQGDADFGRNLEFKGGENVFLAIVGGAALSFYALIGFEDSVNVAEETHDPSRIFPRALFTGLAVAGVIYLLVTLAASSVVPVADLSASDGPLLEVVKQGPLNFPVKLFSFIALLAVANGALINMITASRLVYGMSRREIVPRAFSRVLEGRRTPHVAIAFTTAIAAVLIATGDLEDLADTTVLLLLLVFTVVNVTAIVLRRDTVEHDHFTAPVVLPALGAVVSLALIVDTVLDDSSVAVRAGILLAVGALLYAVNLAAVRREEATPPG